MSSRALRRLQKSKGISSVSTLDDDDNINDRVVSESEGDEEQELPSNRNNRRAKAKKKDKKGPINPFDLLVNDDEPEESNEIQDFEDEVNNENQAVETNATAKSKKKKKKKKGQEKECEKVEQNQSKEEVDEIEATVQEVNRILGDPGVAEADSNAASAEPRFARSCMALLHIDYRNLDPETEMSRIFGAQVVRDNRPNHPRRRNRAAQRSAKLIHPRETWHLTSGSGISMKSLGSDQGFTFEHSVPYQKLQRHFDLAVDSGDPQAVVNVLTENPYHIDSLIQLSDFQRMNEDNQQSAELIEKALFGMEAAFDVMFNLATGNCLLSYKRKENRSFHLCLFKHILYLGQRGCDRTAFEFCKVLLSLDPTNDPLNILSVIDNYALRSMQYDFLIRLERETTKASSILDKVNFAYSVPLAHFLRAVKKKEDTNRADLMLQDRLMMYPVVLLPLLDKCSVQPDSRLARHAFFKTTELQNEAKELNRLVTMYVEGCHPCWKDKDILAWLERNVHAVMDIVDEGKDPRPKDYAAKRSTFHNGATAAMLRHYVLCEIPNIGLPRNLRVTNILTTDPFPPRDSVSGYREPRTPREESAGATNARNAVRLLVHSLNPNFNPNAPVGRHNENGDYEHGQGAAQAIPRLMQLQVQTMVEAMGRMLNNLIPLPVDNGQNQQNNEEPPADDAEWEDDPEGHQ